MRRALLEEVELDRLIDLAHDTGVALRVCVDIDGEATFVAGGLGSFATVAELEHALGDALRAQ